MVVVANSGVTALVLRRLSKAVSRVAVRRWARDMFRRTDKKRTSHSRETCIASIFDTQERGRESGENKQDYVRTILFHVLSSFSCLFSATSQQLFGTISDHPDRQRSHPNGGNTAKKQSCGQLAQNAARRKTGTEGFDKGKTRIWVFESLLIQ